MNEQDSMPKPNVTDQHHDEDNETQLHLAPNQLKASDFETLSNAAFAAEKDMLERGEEPSIISVK